jgi:DNA repair protein RecO (recombination protein O)
MARSRVYSLLAVVLRRNDFGEADRLLTILTPECGKMRVLAKGARKMSSRKAGHVELFTQTRLMLAQGRTFDLITQAELIEAYLPLRGDLQRGGLAHHLSEMSELFAQEDHEDHALYDLLTQGLDWLCTAADPLLAARYFEMRLLTLSGFRPQLFKCAVSGETLEDDLAAAQAGGAPLLYSPSAGGMVARASQRAVREWMPLSASSLALLRALQTQPFDVVAALDVPESLQTELARAMQATLSVVTERRPRAIGLAQDLMR